MKFRGSLLVLALASGLIACRRPSAALPDYGQVPAFELTAQTGEPFNSAALGGKVWVADFFFTSCPGPCPRMTSFMHQVQQATSELTDVRLVSFTVDPERDTPARLTEYAKIHHASPQRWFFLTGTLPQINRLGYHAFKLNPVDGTLSHSTRFALVDAAGHIRGYYEPLDGEGIDKLVSDIRLLARENRS